MIDLWEARSEERRSRKQRSRSGDPEERGSEKRAGPTRPTYQTDLTEESGVIEKDMVEDTASSSWPPRRGVELPSVRCTGDGPVLPSIFRVDAAAAVAVGAATAAAAAFWERRGRP